MFDPLLPVAGLVAAYFLAIWALGLALGRASIVDVAWGPGFALVAWASLALSSTTDPRMWIAAALVSVWALRLALHLGWRQWQEDGEDRRYAAMRANHPNDFAFWSLYMVFGLQAAMLFLISLPLQLGGGSADFGGVLDWLGIGIALFGLGYEALADWQLMRFRAKNESKVLQTGLWAWSRHPNYFGEAVFWWGIFLLVVPSSGNWWLALSPALITALLLRVSGVPLLEAGLKKKRPGYVDYISRTSSFIPLPPKRPPH